MEIYRRWGNTRPSTHLPATGRIQRGCRSDRACRCTARPRRDLPSGADARRHRPVARDPIREGRGDPPADRGRDLRNTRKSSSWPSTACSTSCWAGERRRSRRIEGVTSCIRARSAGAGEPLSGSDRRRTVLFPNRLPVSGRRLSKRTGRRGNPSGILHVGRLRFLPAKNGHLRKFLGNDVKLGNNTRSFGRIRTLSA